jgi:hypothetical protein
MSSPLFKIDYSCSFADYDGLCACMHAVVRSCVVRVRRRVPVYVGVDIIEDFAGNKPILCLEQWYALRTYLHFRFSSLPPLPPLPHHNHQKDYLSQYSNAQNPLKLSVLNVLCVTLCQNITASQSSKRLPFAVQQRSKSFKTQCP